MITLQERVHAATAPGNWTPDKLRRIFRVRKGNKNIGMQENNLLSLSYGNIIRKDIDTAEGLLPESFETYQIVEPGNIVMRLTDLQNDKRSIRQGLVKERGIITSAYDALEVTKGHDSRFWAYALLALDLAKYYYSLGGGVRQSIKFADFPNDWLAAPDLETQKAIADFLDRETARIDQLIEKKQRQVALIEARFEAVLHASITGRFMVPSLLQDSGIEWFGRIPINWNIKPLRHVAFFQRGHDLPSERRIAGGVPLVSSGGITSEHNVGVAQAPGIVTGRYGTIGKFYFLTQTYWPLNTTLYTARVYEDPRFTWYLLQDLAHVFVLNSSKSAVPGVDRNDLHSEKVPVPPRQEQEVIVGFLDAEFAKKESLIIWVEKSIVRLQELRAALITAAVTGQIDAVTWRRTSKVEAQLEAMESTARQKRSCA